MTPEDILLKGTDFRMSPQYQRDGTAYTQYHTSTEFVDPSELFDFSSSTASQAETSERQIFQDALSALNPSDLESFAFELYHRNVVEANAMLAQPGYNAIPISSGSDADAILASCCAHTENLQIDRITVGMEESGRLVSSFQDLSVDISQVPFQSSFSKAVVVQANSELSKVIEWSTNIRLRTAEGFVRPIKEIEDQIEALAKRSIDRGHTVLLRSIHCSKTGIQAPSAEFMRNLRSEYGERVFIYTDICQLRVGKQRLEELFECSDACALSFSKFIQTPPFSGFLYLRKDSILSDTITAMGTTNLGLLLKSWIPSVTPKLSKTCLLERIAVHIRIRLGLERFTDLLSMTDEELGQRLSTIRVVTRSVAEGFGFVQELDELPDCPTQVETGIVPLVFDMASLHETPKDMYTSIHQARVEGKRVLLGQPVQVAESVEHPRNYNMRVSLGWRLMSRKDEELEVMLRDCFHSIATSQGLS